MFKTNFDPLEQFEIIKLIEHWYFMCVPTNLHIALLLNFFIIWVAFYIGFIDNKSFVVYRYSRIHNNVNFFFWIYKKLYEVVNDVINEHVNQRKNAHVLLVFFIFITILTCNMLGLLPNTHTVSSSLIFVFFLSSTLFIGINTIGFYKYEITFFNIFLPGGTPILIAPLLSLIEFISYLSRLFSLSIRLFANMLSGHSLVKIITIFAYAIGTAGGVWALISVFLLFIITLIMILEFAIAFLQAYVYIILTCSYINDATNISH